MALPPGAVKLALWVRAVEQHGVADVDPQRAVVASRPPRPAPRSGATGTAAARSAPASAWWRQACVLLGSNTSASRPLPKSGRITRSPGAVNSTCSMRSRIWSSRSVVARAAEAVEVVGEVEVGPVHHRLLRSPARASARRRGSSGVPVGTQVDWPAMVDHRRAAGEHAGGADDPLAGDAGRVGRAGERAAGDRVGRCERHGRLPRQQHARERRERRRLAGMRAQDRGAEMQDGSGHVSRAPRSPSARRGSRRRSGRSC